MGFFPRLSAVLHRRTVGHFQHVGHMAGGGGIQYGNVNPIMDDFQHLRHQESCPQHYGFAGFQIDFHPIGLPQVLHQANEPLPVVVRPGDVVAAAQIQPFQAVEILAEFFLKGVEGGFQIVGVLLTQSVQMQSVQHGQDALVKIGLGGAQPGTGSAGVIDGVALLRGALRVDAQADGLPRSLCLGTEFLHLQGGVKHDVVGISENLIELLRPVGGGEHMGLPAEFLMTQPGFIQAAGGGARQILFQKRIGVGHGKGLLRQQDFASRFFRHIL